MVELILALTVTVSAAASGVGHQAVQAITQAVVRLPVAECSPVPRPRAALRIGTPPRLTGYRTW